MSTGDGAPETEKLRKELAACEAAKSQLLKEMERLATTKSAKQLEEELAEAQKFAEDEYARAEQVATTHHSLSIRSLIVLVS